MGVEEKADGTLVVTHDGLLAASCFLVLGGLVAIGAAIEAFASGTGERLIALLGATGTLVLIGVVMAERSRFAFDPKTRNVQWRRRWAWWSDEGSIPFAQIAEVVVDVPIGDDGVPSRRIVLRVAGRRDLPFTASYRTDGDGKLIQIGQKLRAMLGHAVSKEPAGDDVEALVRSGRTIDAVKRLREAKGLSLSEAAREIDAIRSRSR